MSTEVPDFEELLLDLKDGTCPGCDERQGYLSQPGADEWWCSDCLRSKLTNLLDAIEAETGRPQRPAMSLDYMTTWVSHLPKGAPCQCGSCIGGRMPVRRFIEDTKPL